MIASRPYLNPYLRISEGRLTSRECSPRNGASTN